MCDPNWTVRICVVALLFVCLLAPAPLAAQSTAPESSVLDDRFVREEGKRGLDLLYNMEFERAEAIFSRIDRRFPDHPIGPFLNALGIWWQIMLDLDNTEYDDAFMDAMEEVVDRADVMLQQDPESFDAAFFKGAALGFRGRLRSNRGSWFRAALDGRRAMRYVLRVAEEDSGNHDFVFGKGMYDYYAAMLPERYPFARPFMVFFPDGDRERGLRLLERTADEGWYIQTEATYFLLQINYLFERNFSESQKYATRLREAHPRNPFFHNYEGRVYARWGHWQQARSIFEEVLERHEAGMTGYNEAMAEPALYYLARSDMAFRRYDSALRYLGRLEQVTARTDEDSYYKVLGRLRQGMVFDATGRRAQAEERYRTVLRMEDQAGSHSRARQYLREPYGQ